MAKRHWTYGGWPIVGGLLIIGIGGWLLGEIHESNLNGVAKFAAWIVIGAAMIGGLVGGAHLMDRAKLEHDIKEESKRNTRSKEENN